MPSNQETAPNEQPFGAVENYADVSLLQVTDYHCVPADQQQSFDFGAFMHNAGDGGEEQHGVDGIISDFDFENFLNVEQGTNWDNAPFNFDTSLGTES